MEYDRLIIYLLGMHDNIIPALTW